MSKSKKNGKNGENSAVADTTVSVDSTTDPSKEKRIMPTGRIEEIKADKPVKIEIPGVGVIETVPVVYRVWYTGTSPVIVPSREEASKLFKTMRSAYSAANSKHVERALTAVTRALGLNNLSKDDKVSLETAQAALTKVVENKAKAKAAAEQDAATQGQASEAAAN